MLVLIVGRPVGASVWLLEVAFAEVALDEATEVVVNVGKAVSVLVSEGAAALVSERLASLLGEVAAAASLVVDMMGSGWECGRPVRYDGLMQA